MSPLKDYYHFLGIRSEASAGDIKSAYRALTRAFHPDRNPDNPRAETRFREIREAYDILSDPTRRHAYDRQRSILEVWTTLGGQGTDQLSNRDNHNNYSAPLPTEGKPKPEVVEVTLDFDEALRGGSKEIKSPAAEVIRLKYPPGVANGNRLTIPETDTKRPMTVVFRVQASPRFRRERNDLYITETISALEAMVGTTRAINDAYGQTIRVQVPPGTQPGERLRLRGQGVRTDKAVGDLLVDVRVSVPRMLTPEQREALKSIAQKEGIL
jgi:curved DNA-binding protein